MPPKAEPVTPTHPTGIRVLNMHVYIYIYTPQFYNIAINYIYIASTLLAAAFKYA